MVVCLCQGVPEKRVRSAIDAGCRTRKAVTQACGAGDGCGGCHDAIREMIREHADAGAPRLELPSRAEPAAACA